jgi:hypothetical protein
MVVHAAMLQFGIGGRHRDKQMGGHTDYFELAVDTIWPDVASDCADHDAVEGGDVQSECCCLTVDECEQQGHIVAMEGMLRVVEEHSEC